MGESDMKYVRAWKVEGFKAVPPYERILKVLLSPDLKGPNRVSVGLSLIPVDSTSSSHIHENEEEIWYILSGRGRIVVGDEELLAEPDTVIYIPSGIEHQLVNTGDETFKVLWIISPPGPEKAFIGKKGGKA